MSERASTIGANSKVSIALLGGIFVVAITATWGGSRWAATVDQRLANIEVEFVRGTTDRWTKSDMRAWSLLFRATNPMLAVPVPGGD